MAWRLRQGAARAWFIGLASLAGLVLTLVLLIAWLLASESGRLTLLGQAERWLPSLTGQTLTITGARSPSLTDWSFEQLRWQGGPDGPSVDAEQLTLRWQPSYLWQRRLWINELDADALTVSIPASETPANTDTPSAGIPDVSQIWARLPALRLDQLDVRQLSVAHPAVPSLTGHARGELAINWGSWPIRLDLNLSEGDSQLTLAVNVDAVNALRVQGDLYAPADSQWAQAFDWPLAQDVVGQWDLELRQPQGQLEAQIHTLILPWRERSLRAQGGISLNPANNRLFFSEFEISADGRPARLHGYIQADQADLNLQAEALPLALARPWLPEGLDGTVSVDGQLSGGWLAPRFAGTARFDGQWRDEALQLTTRSSATLGAVTIDELALNWGPAALSAVGRIDWAQQQLNLTIDAQHLADRHWRPWVPAWPNAIAIDDANFNGTLSGALRDPTLAGDLVAAGRYNDQPVQLTSPAQVSRAQLTLAEISLDSDLGRVEGDLIIDFNAARLDARSRFFELHSNWLTVLGAPLPGEHDWRVSGELDWSGALTNPDARGALTVSGQWQAQELSADIAVADLNLHRLQLADSQISLGDARSGIAGSVNWKERRLDLSAAPQGVRLSSIRPFMAPWPTLLDSLSGEVNGRFQLRGPWAQPRLSSDLSVTGQWQEAPLTAELQVQAEQRQRWQVEGAHLHWGGIQLDYQGWIEPFTPALDGQFRLREFDPAQLRTLPINLPEPFDQLNGIGRAEGRLSGDLRQPTLSDAQLSFEGQLDNTELHLDIDVERANRQQLAIDRLQLTSGLALLVLSGDIDWPSGNLDVEAELEQLDWQRLEPWAPAWLSQRLSTLSGAASGQLSAQGQWPRVNIDGELSAAGRYLDDSFRLNWRGQGQWSGQLRHSLSLNWGTSRLSGELSSEGEALDGQLSVAELSVEQVRALGVPLDSGVSGQVTADLGVAGTLADPLLDLQLQANGRWQPASIGLTDATDWRIDIDGQGQRDDWQLHRAEADLGKAGRLLISGSGSLDALTLNGQVNIVDSRYWLANRPEWAGELTGNFALSGSNEEPNVEAHFDWRSERWPLALYLDLNTLEGEHRLNAQLYENEIPRLSVAIHTAQTALQDWQGEPTDRPFNAEFNFDTDSTVFDPFFQGRPDQDFSGQITGQLSIDGSLTQPQWNGTLNLSDGRYENATYGAVLSRMNGQLSADNRTLQLQLEAADDGGGQVQLDGSVVWPEERTEWWMPELDLTMNVRNAHLLRRADMDASVTGELSLTGPWRDLTAAGNLDIAPLTIQLNSLLQSGAPSLNIVRSNGETDDAEDDAENEARLLAPQGQWQVRLKADRRAQIYGQGLEAELSGELDLTDDLSSPNVGGRFQVIRGTYTAFGKIFQITDGNIQVQGSQILIDINATYTSPDLSVDLRVTGTQDQLNLMLTSTPALANDELLARLLFGTTLNEMSAVQAFQLATALNSLRDPNSGLDLFGTTRELLGLDSLSLDSTVNEAGETSVNVQAGKYLSDQLYLEVESGVRTEQSFAGRLQFQVTPQVSLELYTNGQYGSGGLELNWSEDY